MDLPPHSFSVTQPIGMLQVFYDGILDSQRERIELKLDNVAAGEHLLAVRAFDSAGNVGLGKVVIR